MAQYVFEEDVKDIQQPNPQGAQYVFEDDLPKEQASQTQYVFEDELPGGTVAPPGGAAPERWSVQASPDITVAPDTLNANAQPDLSALQDRASTPVAPGMPANVAEVQPQGLNERGQDVLINPLL